MPHRPSDLVDRILLMNRLGQLRRQWRFDHGALSLQRAKLGFKLGEDGQPVDFFKYIQRESNQMVEEFMLLANQVRLLHH